MTSGVEEMRGPCHTLTPCPAVLPGRAPDRGRPPRQTLRTAGDGGSGTLLPIEPVAHHSECAVAIETERAHQVGHRSIHVAAAFGAEAPKKGMKPGLRPSGRRAHELSGSSRPYYEDSRVPEYIPKSCAVQRRRGSASERSASLTVIPAGTMLGAAPHDLVLLDTSYPRPAGQRGIRLHVAPVPAHSSPCRAAYVSPDPLVLH